MRNRITDLLAALVISFLVANNAFAVTYHYEGDAGSAMYINYYSPQLTNYARLWSIGDTGFLTASWDCDTGAFEISGLFTAPNTTDADRNIYPDLFFSAIEIHVAQTITPALFDNVSHPASGSFRLSGFPFSVQILGNGLGINRLFFNDGGTLGGMIDRSSIFLSDSYVVGNYGNPSYLTEVGTNDFRFSRIPEPRTSGLMILGLTFILASIHRNTTKNTQVPGCISNTN